MVGCCSRFMRLLLLTVPICCPSDAQFNHPAKQTTGRRCKQPLKTTPCSRGQHCMAMLSVSNGLHSSCTVRQQLSTQHSTAGTWAPCQHSTNCQLQNMQQHLKLKLHGSIAAGISKCRPDIVQGCAFVASTGRAACRTAEPSCRSLSCTCRQHQHSSRHL